MKRIAINGFGRIGRLAFRQFVSRPEFDVVSINDLTDVNTLAHLLKYDRIHGAVPGEVSVSEGNLVKVFGWYDNEAGYATRVVDLAQRLA